jgi:hypothetical protein
MKTNSIQFVVLAFLSTLMFLSCKHVPPPESCESIGFKIYVTQTDALLNGSNGTITATATGGKGFQFSLNNGAFSDNGNFTGLLAYGNYRVVGRNSSGCTDTTDVTIGSIDPCKGVVINLSTTKVDALPNQTNGSINATATGGSGFSYSLNSGAFQTSGTFSNLAAGTYTIAAKSAAGCIGTTQVTIGTNNPCTGVVVTVTTTIVQPGVNLSNGSITATATGGSGFTYSINGGAYQTSGTFSGLAAGNYTITAKNSNGCTGSVIVALGANNPCSGVTILVSTTQIDPLQGQLNGSITASATGGTGFTYSLNNGAFQTSGLFSNLAAGTYTVTAKSSSGCIGTKQVVLTAVSQCANLNIVITPTVVNTTPCVTPANNGSITVNATGSTGFTYNINGGTYQTSNIFTALNAGNYLIGVKDANGCTKTLSVTVAVVAPGPNFAQMRILITTRCSGSGCHMNGTTTAGYNFDSDCSIVTKWSQINAACVTYTLKRMPISPQAILSASEKLIITNWVNAGHRYTD